MTIKPYRSQNTDDISNLRNYLIKNDKKPVNNNNNKTVQKCSNLCTFFRQAYWRGNPKLEEKSGRYCFSPDDIKEIEEIYYKFRHIHGISLLQKSIKLDDDCQKFPILMHNYEFYNSFVSNNQSDDDQSDDYQSNDERLEDIEPNSSNWTKFYYNIVFKIVHIILCICVSYFIMEFEYHVIKHSIFTDIKSYETYDYETYSNISNGIFN